jgi:hypothetical protein
MEWQKGKSWFLFCWCERRFCGLLLCILRYLLLDHDIINLSSISKWKIYSIRIIWPLFFGLNFEVVYRRMSVIYVDFFPIQLWFGKFSGHEKVNRVRMVLKVIPFAFKLKTLPYYICQPNTYLKHPQNYNTEIKPFSTRNETKSTRES